MIETKKIIAKIRYKQKDVDEVKYSDYDILQALNECLEYLNKSYALQNSDFLEKVGRYDLTTDELTNGIRLPGDFLTIMKVARQADKRLLKVVPVGSELTDEDYFISGDRLYSGDRSITLIYKAVIAELESVDDDIFLPPSFSNTVVNLAVMILNNAETDILAQAVNDATESIIPRRRYSNVKQKMPYIV